MNDTLLNFSASIASHDIIARRLTMLLVMQQGGMSKQLALATVIRANHRRIADRMVDDAIRILMSHA